MTLRIDSAGNIVRNNDIETATPLTLPTLPQQPSIFPSLKNAPLTLKILILQCLIYLISCYIPPMGYFEPSRLALLRIGSVSHSFLACSPCGYVFELRRLIVATFLHSGIAHILMNSLFQIFTCPDLESNLKSSKAFLLQYIGAGFFGNLCFAMYGESAVGASGACYGLLGAAAMRLYLLWPSMDLANREQAKSMIIRQVAILLFLELMAWNSVAHAVHLGGFVSGACIYAILTCDSASASFGSREATLLLNSKAVLIFMTVFPTIVIMFPACADFRRVCADCDSLMSIYN